LAVHLAANVVALRAIFRENAAPKRGISDWASQLQYVGFPSHPLLDWICTMNSPAILTRLLRPRDEELVQAVFAAARSRCTRAGVLGLTVGAKQGRVTLHARAGSFYDKQLLLHAAQHVPGVVEIVDEVDVLAPA
jgi:hypothetical protein